MVSLLRWNSVTLLLAAWLSACSGIPATYPTILSPAEEVSSRSPLYISIPQSAHTEEQKILLVLNRFGYGPRPGDVERIKKIGLVSYLREQLSPETVPDPDVERQLRDFPTLTMTTSQLMSEFPDPDQKLSPEMQKEMFPPEKRPARLLMELQEGKLIRAILSERQLQEVMVDFWFNHFNVDARKGAVKWMVADYERTAIRPHALGKFRDLLLATARHPAMLFYLDNWMSTRTDLVVPAGPQRGRQMGLNENYAREIMELHTLGVDGGYTQQDVVDVARAFTGWSIEKPREQGTFVFRGAAHDQGEK